MLVDLDLESVGIADDEQATKGFVGDLLHEYVVEALSQRSSGSFETSASCARADASDSMSNSI